jgi:hypothetical protein
MDKEQDNKGNKQHGGITDKKDKNAGSGAFNEGTEQDPNYNKGTPVTDEEKQTGHLPYPSSKGKRPGYKDDSGTNRE